MTRITLAILFLHFAAFVLQAQPIQLHPQNPHYFLLNGKTIVLVGSGEHYGAVINPDFDYRRYLAALHSAGLNYTRLFGGSYLEQPGQSFGIKRNTMAPTPGRFVAPWARGSAPGYAGGGNKFDLNQWNAEYFTRFHDFLAEAARQGVVVELTLFSAQYATAQWELSAFNSANNVNNTTLIDWKKVNTLENGNILAFQERYTRKLVHEAVGFDNVIFELQNEPWADRTVLTDVVNPYLPTPARDQYPNSIDLADQQSIDWQTQVARWITSEEAQLPHKHLIAQNYCNFRLPVRSLIPGVSIVNFHYAYPEAALLNYEIGKAIAYDETGFLGRSDDVYRRQAWNFMLSGGSTFDHLDYSFSVGHEDGSDEEANGPGGGSPALRNQLRILRNFLETLPLIDMKSETTVVKHVAGAYARVLAKPGREYAIYLDGRSTAELLLDLPPGNYSAQWLNTKTGGTERTDSFEHKGGEKFLSPPPFENGIALRLTVR